MNIKQYEVAEVSGMNIKLIRAVTRQHGDWSSLLESYQDIVSHGASGGVSNFIYYSETVDFYRKHKKLIIEQIERDIESYGEGNLLSFIEGMNAIRGEFSADEIARAIYQGKGDDIHLIFNTLTWYALESVAQAIEYTVDSLEG